MFSKEMAGQGPELALSEADDRLQAFVREVTAALLMGRRHQTAGLGTFSTCTRKATAERAACKIAMFRASAELRAFAAGGPSPSVSGPHALVVSSLVKAMQSEEGVIVPLLGRLAVVPVPGRKPRLIFQGAKALNDALTVG